MGRSSSTPNLEIVGEEGQGRGKGVGTQEMSESEVCAGMEADEAPHDLDGVGALSQVEGRDERLEYPTICLFSISKRKR